MQDQQIEDKISDMISNCPGVLLAYLFGSQAGNLAGPESDYDFAILAEDAEDFPALRAQLAHDLGGVLGTGKVDLVILNRAPVELAYSVIAQGKPIYQRDEAARVEFEAGVLNRYGDYLPVLRAQRADICRGGSMLPEFTGIERRLDELSERLARLEPLRERHRADFDADPYLRDIVERNLEIAAQCCIDISHRIISIERAGKPRDYYEAILRLGDLNVLPTDFAIKLAPLAGFRNVLVHEYVGIDWDEVYANLQGLDDVARFAAFIRSWLGERSGGAA